MGYLDKVKGSGSSAVEGEVTGYEFTAGFPLVDPDDRQDTDNIFLALKLLPEGADEEVTRPLYLGSGAYLVIEEDGQVLRAGEDGEVNEENTPRLYEKGEVYKFIASLADAGFPVDSRFPDPEESKSIDFRGLIGTRLRIVNETDEEATKEFGKRKVTKGKHKGKEFNRTWTKVSKVLTLPSDDAKKGKALSSKPDTKGKKATAKDDDEDAGVDTKTADKFIKEVIKAEGGKIAREKLTLAITRLLTKKKMDLNENADLRKFLTSEEYLVDAAEREVINFDASAKKQVISEAE
jgi:hypothetical protein